MKFLMIVLGVLVGVFSVSASQAYASQMGDLFTIISTSRQNM